MGVCVPFWPGDVSRVEIGRPAFCGRQLLFAMSKSRGPTHVLFRFFVFVFCFSLFSLVGRSMLLFVSGWFIPSLSFWANVVSALWHDVQGFTEPCLRGSQNVLSCLWPTVSDGWRECPSRWGFKEAAGIADYC